jgi:energy-coupling factor transport system ATP-binding protein
MLKTKNLTFYYKGTKHPAIEDVDLTFTPGTLTGITGSSGSGKTTLLLALCGAIPHFIKGDFYGEVLVCGKDTALTKPTGLAKDVNLVMQDTDSAFVAVEPLDEVIFGLENFGYENAEMRAMEALEKLGVSDLAHRPIRALSGGQKRKVAIAAVIALEPKILLLDEPTGELDPEAKHSVFKILKTFANEGMTVVVSEKNRELLNEYCDTTLSLD